jgi:hypothetical protein
MAILGVKKILVELPTLDKDNFKIICTKKGTTMGDILLELIKEFNEKNKELL